MERTAINYIEFYCSNLEVVKDFYSNTFGWTFTDYGNDYAAFEDGVLTGGFHQSGQGSKGGNPLVILYSAQLEAVRERVIASGGVITADIFSFPGGRRFHFADPDGNVLAVWGE